MSVPRGRRTRFAVASTLALALLLNTGVPLSRAFADERPSPTSRTASTPTAAPKTPRPYWIELSVAQREALVPLAGQWEGLDGQHKKKWVEIAGRYPKMKPEEQQHAQDRMREWATLTPEQRRVARDSFARVQALPPEKRAEMLQKYRELPPEKKEALTAQGQATKALVIPKTAIKPFASRNQIREGAKTPNPAMAVQKGVAAQKTAVASHPGVPQASVPVPAMAGAPPALPPLSTAPTDKPATEDGAPRP